MNTGEVILGDKVIRAVIFQFNNGLIYDSELKSEVTRLSDLIRNNFGRAIWKETDDPNTPRFRDVVESLDEIKKIMLEDGLEVRTFIFANTSSILFKSTFFD